MRDELSDVRPLDIRLVVLLAADTIGCELPMTEWLLKTLAALWRAPIACNVGRKKQIRE